MTVWYALHQDKVVSTVKLPDLSCQAASAALSSKQSSIVKQAVHQAWADGSKLSSCHCSAYKLLVQCGQGVGEWA